MSAWIKRAALLCTLLACSLTVQAAETETVTEGQKTLRVVIDPGHQGSWVDMSEQEPMGPGSSETKARATTGTQGVYSGVAEYEVNLDVALALKAELDIRGYQVIMTRKDHNRAISNMERAQLATDVKADISVRIHANGSDDGSVNGALTMAPSPDNPYVGELSADSLRLSTCILDEYCAATGLANLGVLYADNMTGINWSTVPVTILEMGFMTNEHDDLYITDSANYETMAKGIADGIDEYFGITRTEETEETEKPGEAEKPEKAEKSGETDEPETAETAAGEAGAYQGERLDGLEAELEQRYLDQLAAAGEAWSVAVLDPENEDYCMVNADARLQSASVIKLFIAATVYERAVYPDEAGKELIPMSEQYDGELKELLTSMITVSDNDAANELVTRLGQGDFDAGAAVVNAFCQEHGFTETHMGRRFLAENPTDDNYTSAEDCCRILAGIYRGELINEAASEKLLELLKGQTRTGKIPAGVPQGTATANKTGEMPYGYGLGSIENDIAVVFAQKPYILCVLSNDIGDNGTAQEIITRISEAVYQYMEGR